MNNQLPIGFVPENSDYNIGGSGAVNANNINNFQLTNKNFGLMPNVNPMLGYPYNIPVGMNMGVNMNVNKLNMFYGLPPNANMNIAGFPMQNQNLNDSNNNNAQAVLDTLTSHKNINYDKKNLEKNQNNKK